MIVAEPITKAVLIFPCDGYAKGTTGTITGEHQGCLVFVPDQSAVVARWAHPRRELLVPASFVAALS